ncbi:MAG: beta-N-acetylhexosaminidase [Gammaproteobacteria bacterium]|jgi:beta-N-acetylhexosaminidase
MSLGPVMVDLRGTAVQPEERELLAHPQVGGVILFARNYESPAQVRELTAQIHAARQPRLLIAVDQEGGRVQRFRDGFTRLPPVGQLGPIHDRDPDRARHLARVTGWLMAAELRAVGVDISFAPVLDLDRGMCPVIGDRALHRDPQAVAELARAYQAGMLAAGMQATGKHFPGHGAVDVDSHVALPVDGRSYADIELEDLVPFERLVHAGMAGVMAAHVVYASVDDAPAGFSSIWLQSVLRHRLGFQGTIFSDDLSMGAAAGLGDCPSRARAALAAGCDMVLVCNAPDDAAAVVDALTGYDEPAGHARLARMHGRAAPDWETLHAQQRWRDAVAMVHGYDDAPLLDMDL